MARRLGTYLLTVVLFGVAVALLGRGGCELAAAQGVDARAAGFNFDAVSVADTPDNPYRWQYEEWDRWIIEHQRGIARGRAADKLLDRGPSEVVMVADVTEDGFLVPYRAYLTQREELHRDAMARARLTEADFQQPQLVSVGVMPQELQDAAHNMAAEVRASYMREIPAWLAELAPERSVLLPDGCIAARGAPELFGLSVNRGEPEQVWVRFDSAGGRLAVTRELNWVFTYLDPAAAELLRGNFDIGADGCVMLKTPPGAAPVIYDYNGVKLDARPSEPRDVHDFTTLPRSILAQYYAAQQRTHLFRATDK